LSSSRCSSNELRQELMLKIMYSRSFLVLRPRLGSSSSIYEGRWRPLWLGMEWVCHACPSNFVNVSPGSRQAVVYFV
jgi:hypothetical protein